MPMITYVLPDGSESSIDVPVGQTVMDGSVRNGLPGIVAECGGSCSCGTCHVHVRDTGAASAFGDATDEERDLLEFLPGADECSRLACQLLVSASVDGARVHVAGDA